VDGSSDLDYLPTRCSPTTQWQRNRPTGPLPRHLSRPLYTSLNIDMSFSNWFVAWDIVRTARQHIEGLLAYAANLGVTRRTETRHGRASRATHGAPALGKRFAPRHPPSYWDQCHLPPISLGRDTAEQARGTGGKKERAYHSALAAFEAPRHAAPGAARCREPPFSLNGILVR